MNLFDATSIEKFNSAGQTILSVPEYINKPFKFLYLTTGEYLVILNPVGGSNFNYAKAFKIIKDTDGKYQIVNPKNEISDKPLTTEEMKDFPSIQLQDITKCTYEMAREDYTIKFWDKGAYQGMVAYMPIQRDEGWYFATKADTGLEGQLVSYKDTGKLNEYWICNVGPNGKAEFNFYSGPEGDDDCCIEISKTTNMEIPDMYKALADRAEKCIPAATSSYNKKENPINTGGGCGKPSLGKPPVAIPSTQCEDFMSPDECSLMFNLCDPVICPSSRCDLGGRFPVDNVIQSGIIGSLVLCSQNAGEVAVPICISGLYNGLDAFNNMVFKQYKSCLEKQVSSGQTTGLCDYWHSVYFCQLLWNNLDPFIKAGIPAVTASITQGGGEYSMFSEAFKSSQDSLAYFTQTYGPNAFTSFKANSVNQTGTTVCDKFISITYPTAAKFFD